MSVMLGNLCELRKEKLLTMAELAEISGVAISVISRAESGSNISIASAKKISSALDVELERMPWSRMKNLRKNKMTTYSNIRHAISKGNMKKSDVCEDCGINGKLHGHHEDYSLPLNVVWLCPKCHKQRHLKMKNDTQKVKTMFFL